MPRFLFHLRPVLGEVLENDIIRELSGRYDDLQGKVDRYLGADHLFFAQYGKEASRRVRGSRDVKADPYLPGRIGRFAGYQAKGPHISAWELYDHHLPETAFFLGGETIDDLFDGAVDVANERRLLNHGFPEPDKLPSENLGPKDSKDENDQNGDDKADSGDLVSDKELDYRLRHIVNISESPQKQSESEVEGDEEEKSGDEVFPEYSQ